MNQEAPQVESTETPENTQETPQEAPKRMSLGDALAAEKAEPQVDETGRPTDIPEEFWDSENKSLKADEVFKAYQAETKRSKGLRDKLANGAHKAPEDAKEYAIEFEEDVEEDIRKIDDSILSVTQEAALKAGLSKDQFNAFMATVVPTINKMSLEAANKPLTQEQIQENIQQEIRSLGPGAERVVEAVDSFLAPFKMPGVLNESEQEFLSEITSYADGYRILNKMRAHFTGDNYEVGEAQGGKFGWSKSQEAELGKLIIEAQTNPAKQSIVDKQLKERARFGITGPLRT